MNGPWVLVLYSAKKRTWISWMSGTFEEVLTDALEWSDGTGVPREAYPALRIERTTEYYEETSEQQAEVQPDHDADRDHAPSPEPADEATLYRRADALRAFRLGLAGWTPDQVALIIARSQDERAYYDRGKPATVAEPGPTQGDDLRTGEPIPADCRANLNGWHDWREAFLLEQDAGTFTFYIRSPGDQVTGVGTYQRCDGCFAVRVRR